MRSLPIEIMTMEKVIDYMLKVEKKSLTLTSTIAWEANKKIQNMHKNKIYVSVGCKIWKKWITFFLPPFSRVFYVSDIIHITLAPSLDRATV